MDIPNATNPANPNAQDQFVDVVQGPANQAQGPMVQNQAQGPAGQNPGSGSCKSKSGSGPCRSNSHSRSCSSNSSSRSHTGWSKYTNSATTTTSCSTTGPCWYCSAHSSDNLSKLDRKET